MTATRTPADGNLLFAQQIVRGTLRKAAKEQSAAWNMRHAAHGHEVTAAANLECDHELALCYIYEPAIEPTTLAEVESLMAELEAQHSGATDIKTRGDLANRLRTLDKQRRTLRKI